MKRVLFIASKPLFPWRSPCIRAGHDLVALTQLGYEVDFLTIPIGSHLPIPNVRILRVPNILFARNLPEGSSLRKVVFDLLLLVAGMVLVLRNRYAVVHGMDDAGVVAWMTGRLGRCAVVFEKHADTTRASGGPWCRFLTRIYRRLEGFALRRADTTIGAGPEFMAAMQAMGRGSRACRIPDIPSTLKTPSETQVAECRARLVNHLDDLLVTGVGSFAVFQGLDLLFDAIPRVCATDDRVHFVVVGGAAREIARQRRLLADKGLQNVVTFLGRIKPDELAAVLTASDILVAPRLESTVTPMKVLDYLHSGTAIVATDRPANRDVLTPDVVELTRPNADALADGILALCRDPVRRHDLGLRGREMIALTHRFDQFRESLRCCYDYVTAVQNN